MLSGDFFGKSFVEAAIRMEPCYSVDAGFLIKMLRASTKTAGLTTNDLPKKTSKNDIKNVRGAPPSIFDNMCVLKVIKMMPKTATYFVAIFHAVPKQRHFAARPYSSNYFLTLTSGILGLENSSYKR